MREPRDIFGRLGNQMFQYAKLYSVARDEGIDPYFQNPKHFEKYEAEIKVLFSDGIGYLPYVGVHLRRGDYVDNPFYVDLAKTGYYINATNLFPDRKFLVFSDDIAFAKTYFEGDKFAFDESDNEIEAFNKLASCSDQIIANSSFSWWAGYLNPNVQKKVVAPTNDKWHQDGIERTVVPSSWTRI